MKPFLIIILLPLGSFSQKLQRYFVGVNSSFYADDFPPDLFGSISSGLCKGHFYAGLEFTNCMGYRETSFQLLGIMGRVNFRPNEKIFNVFLETHLSTQIAGKRRGTPMEQYTFRPIPEYSPYFQGDRFLKANFQGTFGFGASILVNRIGFDTSFGLSVRQWSSYKSYNTSMTNMVSTEGLFLRIGLSYHFEL